MNPKKIKIGVFSYDFYPVFGGMGRHIYEIYKQNQIHKKITMFIFSPNSNNLENNIQIFPETLNSKLKNIEYSVKLNNKFEKSIQKYNLDLIHLHGGPGGIFLLKKLSVPVVYTTHHTYWQQYHYIKQQKLKYFFYIFEKNSYNFSNKIICVSNDTAKILQKYYNINKSTLTYIPNGVDTNYFKPQKNTSPENTQILYVGRIEKRKGIDFLIKSMRLVSLKNPEIILHVVGEGSYKTKIEKYSQDNHLPIIFYGHLSDKKLELLYEKISIQIVPSLFEGFGLTVLEGMSKKIPIIATDTDGIKDIITNNINGKLVKFGNEPELSKAILDLTGNPRLRQKFIDNASSNLKNYNWEDIYFQTIKNYEALIQ